MIKEDELEKTEKDNQAVFKSRGERRIAEFLERCGIRYVYEQPLAICEEGKTMIWHPDFYLPDFAIYIEYYGMAGKAGYDERTQRKNSIYARMEVAVIPFYPRMFDYAWQRHVLNCLRSISEHRLGSFIEVQKHWRGQYRAKARLGAMARSCAIVSAVSQRKGI